MGTEIVFEKKKRRIEPTAGDVEKAFKSLEDVVAAAYRSTINLVEAETDELGAEFWKFPYTRPVSSLASESAYGTVLSESSSDVLDALGAEARARLKGTFKAFLKAGRNVGRDFSRLSDALVRESLPIKTFPFLPIREKTLGAGVIETFLTGMEWVDPEGSVDFGLDSVKYLSLCAACALCGEELTRLLLGDAPWKAFDMSARDVGFENDVVTKRLHGRGEGHFTPADYMSGMPHKIKTGRNISVKVLIENDFDVTEACENYQLNDTDRFWLEAVSSIAKTGHTRITGYDMLRISSFKNPYAPGMASTMRSAYTSVMKAMRTRIAIDVTEEYEAYAASRGRAIGDRGAVRLKPIIKGDMVLIDLAEGSVDFAVELDVDETGDPLSALPLAQYASDKKQMITAKVDDFIFRSIKRMTLEHKRIWRHVVRRVSEKGTSNTILIETMFRELQLDNITKQKRSLAINALRTMLAERSEEYDRLKELEEREASTGLDETEWQELELLRSKKLVTSFRFSKRGRVVHSVTVNFNSPSKRKQAAAEANYL